MDAADPKPGVLIGARVAAAMERLKLKQERVAELAGVSQTFVSDLVAGKTGDPRIAGLLRIAAALEIDHVDLFADLWSAMPPEGVAGTGSPGTQRRDPRLEAADLWERYAVLLKVLATVIEVIRPAVPALPPREAERLDQALQTLRDAEQSRAS